MPKQNPPQQTPLLLIELINVSEPLDIDGAARREIVSHAVCGSVGLATRDSLSANHTGVRTERGRLHPEQPAVGFGKDRHMGRTEPQTAGCIRRPGRELNPSADPVCARAGDEITRLK